MYYADLTSRVISVLETQTERPVGDGVAPKDPQDLVPEDYPYAVVYPGDTNWRLMDGPLTDSQGDKSLKYHVVSVAYSREGSERLAERVRAAMVWENFSDFSGVRVLNVTMNEIQSMERTTEIRPAVFTLSDTFLFRVTES